MKDLIGRLSQRMNLRRNQVERTVSLFDQDNTVPFIARYRKEVTDGMDEETLAEFRKELEALRKLAARQETVVKTIEDQGKLTPQLEDAIEEVETIQELEDIYLPYKPRRRTRAQIARERGLEPLAVLILEQADLDQSLEDIARSYLSEEVQSTDDAWSGARDIVAELISDEAQVRDVVRRITWEQGLLTSALTKAENDPKRTFEVYYEFEKSLKLLKPHQVLAINRGENVEALRIKVNVNHDGMLRVLNKLFPVNTRTPLAQELLIALEDSFARLVFPAIEREVRRDLTGWADEHAITVFATNMRNLLLTPPIKGAVVLGIDPGYRTGCKVAVVDTIGRVLDIATIYPHSPQAEWRAALDDLHELVAAYDVSLIAVGNGTASRESEELAAQLIKEREGLTANMHYMMVNEAGASVYSASPLARAELPELDVSIRGAVSIARRAQDPLSELVKIDPKSIGVGMYQHDVDQKLLAESLEWVTQSVVNAVGVDVNTASPALLQHIAGLGPRLAEKITEHRDMHGAFVSRQAIKKVKGLGAKTFEQAAGFMRISAGDNLLDNTGVHPESYAAVKLLLSTLNIELADVDLADKLGRAQAAYDTEKLAEQIGLGLPTLDDIYLELQRPGRDPRDDIPAPLLRQDVLRMEDLVSGMKLFGTVRNVVDFGAFVDIGVKQDGLIHISRMADYRVESPYEIVGVGDVVEVTILDVDLERGRIGLSLI